MGDDEVAEQLLRMHAAQVDIVAALEERSGYGEFFRALERPPSAAAVTGPVRGTAR
ncbi:hypothetical protein O2W18_08780 [Modestobacter sp. VKM Ac-2983]|uniref:hypothetical protein n=1 Tax=Modestobacter sp. VKM Ac-2983 TaxID=3004137 RepID=UPI0022AB7F9E|nr:hypothetical protein [Modestobacter sp. VKM Ac-2983]MCZ2805194.1 hypothetical protein [Modestobacter sp. VKM Ac-2983]